jgi:hypothetical protein
VVTADYPVVADAFTGYLVFAALVGLYFAPTIVARERKVPNFGSIAVIYVFLGWTLVGWVVALAMAFRSVPPGTAPTATSAAVTRKCRHCGRSMDREATVCPHCGSESSPWIRHAGFWWAKASTSDRWQWLDETARIFRWYPEGTPSNPSETTDQTPSRALDPTVISPPGADPPLQIEQQATSPATTTSAELERLAELHARGVLNDEEFQQAKQQVLRG